MSGLIFKSTIAKMGVMNAQPKPIPLEKSLTIGPGGLGAVRRNIAEEVLAIPPFTIYPAFRNPTATPRSPDSRLQKELGPDNRFSAYEELTGVSKIRPEILLVTNFQPLFDDNASRVASESTDVSFPGLNALGEFFDAQIQIQHLRHEAVVKLINDLKKDATVAELLRGREVDFRVHMRLLTLIANNLYEVVVGLDNVKRKLGIKNNKIPNYEMLMYRYFSDTLAPETGEVSYDNVPLQRILRFDVTSLNDLTYPKALGYLGYNAKNVSKFTSTKVFLQTMYELQGLLLGLSYNVLGTTPTRQRNDRDVAFLNKHTPPGFSFDAEKIASYSTANFNNFLTPDSTLEVANVLKRDFDELFNGASFSSNESRLAFIFSFLSREFTFSRALSNSKTQTFLRDAYGYAVSATANNRPVWDYVFGFLGDKITDRTDTLSNGSLANITQKFDGSTAVLNFEPEYIDFEKSSYTPGAVYFVEKAFDATSQGFNMQNLQAFSLDLHNQTTRFVNAVKLFELLPTQKIFQNQDRRQGALEDRMPAASDVFERVLNPFLDVNTMLPRPGVFASDALGIFTLASTDNYLKSLLFIYVYLKLFSKSGENSRSLELLMKEIDAYVNGPHRVGSELFGPHSPLKSMVVDKESVTSELKELRNVSAFLNSFFMMFLSMYEAFTKSGCVVNNHTWFSGMNDMTLLMVIFEAILGVVSTYTPKVITHRIESLTAAAIGGSFFLAKAGPGPEDTQTIEANTLSINMVKAKLEGDVNAVAQLTFSLVGSLTELNDSIGIVNRTLRNPYSIEGVKNVGLILQDPQLLQLLLNPQQIFLLKSSIDDINNKLSAELKLPKDPGNIDFELRGPGRDDIALLDDSLISRSMKNVLFSFFSNDRFSSQKGFNMRLLTVGIPAGFSQKLRERSQLGVDDSVTARKQVDIVRVNVFKVDVEYQDLVFKPQSFLFELSRFVPRFLPTLKDITVSSTQKQLFEAIPLRDYSPDTQDEKADLNSATYSFLTVPQKTEIVENHISSYLFETYIRLLTGISVSEYDLIVNGLTSSYSISSTVADHIVNFAVSKTFNVDINATDFEITENLSSTQIETMRSFMTIAETAKKSRTVYSDQDNEAKRIMSPKVFDRVFNVAVDPDDFEIDVAETLKTPTGKETFDKLQKLGVIVGVDTQSGFYANQGGSTVYKLRERNIMENDLTFEKYFITVGPALDEVI